jgi:hypothetical protein
MFVSFGFRLELIGKKKARVSERTVYLYRAFVMERGAMGLNTFLAVIFRCEFSTGVDA